MLDKEHLRAILYHDTLYWACISLVEEQEGFLLFHNQNLIPRIDPNHAGQFRAEPGKAGWIVEEIIRFYHKLGAVPAAYVDCLTSPPDLIPALFAAGFQAWDGAVSDLMVYTGSEPVISTSFNVETLTTIHDREDWASITDVDDPMEQALLQKLYLLQLADPRMTGYIIRVDGQPVCRCQLFSSDGIGRVEAVRTRIGFRGRGLASAAIRCAVRDSLRQNRLTYLYAEPEGDPQRLYLHLGFENCVHDFIRSFLYP